MKGTLSKTKGMAKVHKFIKMVTYILESFKIIKNMHKGSFSGLVSMQNQKWLHNCMKVSGGEAYLMGMALIKK